MLDEVISDGIIKKKERQPGKTPSICFYIGKIPLHYTVPPEEEPPEQETNVKYASNYFG